MSQNHLNSPVPTSNSTHLGTRASTVFGIEREFLVFSLGSLLGLRGTPGAASSVALHAASSAAVHVHGEAAHTATQTV